jgi:hypothetical protein
VLLVHKLASALSWQVLYVLLENKHSMKQIFQFYFIFGVELPVHLEVIVICIFQFYFLLGAELPVHLEVTVIYNYI